MQIAASLRVNNVLESLDVSGNSLYIQGLKHLQRQFESAAH